MAYEDNDKPNISFGGERENGRDPISVSDVKGKQDRKGGGWRILFSILFLLSVLGNIFLFLILMVLAAMVLSGPSGMLREKVLIDGPSTQKIVVIDLQGVIVNQSAEDIREQIKAAREDRYVKGLILRIYSPGGTISGSDDIYHEILRYRKETGKPVLAVMKGIAASGGYYASVACDKIIAEPTTITGSIGVIMNYFVLEELLEMKLGIEPVVVKSGKRKDWPSYFQKPDEEQLQYFDEKLIQPAYERFVSIVDDGRSDLSIDEVRRLADGSIYGAQEALDNKMIDEIGYFEDAVDAILSMARLKEAQVVEYKRPFSMMNLFGSQVNRGLKLDKQTLYEFMLPEALYLCDYRGN